MTRIERARLAVITAWQDGGFCPVLYAEAIENVASGKMDHQMPVKIALAAFEMAGGE